MMFLLEPVGTELPEVFGIEGVVIGHPPCEGVVVLREERRHLQIGQSRVVLEVAWPVVRAQDVGRLDVENVGLVVENSLKRKKNKTDDRCREP